MIWASYWLLNLRDERPLVEKMFWNFLFGFVYVSILLPFSDEFVIPPLEGLAGAIYVGLFEMGVTFLLWYRAVEGDMAFASNLAYLVPFLSLFFIAIIVGESLASATVLGLVMIVSGIIIGRKNGEGLLKGTMNFDQTQRYYRPVREAYPQMSHR